MADRFAVEIAIVAPVAQQKLASDPFREWLFPDGTPWTSFHRVASGYLLRFPGLADFTVSADGRQVTCVPTPEASDATIRHLYLNQVWPLVLGKQGKLVCHASAVEVGGGAVAFVAASGGGKSTLAAAFATQGCRFLADEGLVLERAVEAFQVMPSHPSVRLWEDSQAALFPSGAAMAPPVSFTAKARLLAGDELRFCAEPRRLRRMYFLGNSSAGAITIDRLSAAEAMVELVKASFLLDIEEKPRLASHFDQVAKLAEQPIHFRLEYPRRFEDLPVVRQAIIEHAGGGTG